MLSILPLPTPEDSAEVRRAFEKLKAGLPFPTADEREDRLDRLERLLVKHRDAFVRACDEDFGGRGRHETLIVDVVLTLESVRDARRNLRAWLQRTKVKTHVTFAGSSAYVEHVPKGVVGILAPWNYPVNLALGPLAAALAAGNRVLIKPSELTERVSAAIVEAVREHFTAEEVAVVEGGPAVAQAITKLPLDHLFFTGSTAVGRQVARAAADNLVPVTLELGGKSPAYVQAHYPAAVAAARIAVGKLFNGGQTCVAPDWVLLPEGKEVVFAEAFRAAVRDAWRGASVTAMATEKGLARMRALVEDARAKGARVETVPVGVSGTRGVEPVLLFGVRDDMRVMQEEIFGPLLPVVSYRSEAEALARIAARPAPLAFYVFDDDVERAGRVVATVPCGGACINDTLGHFANEELPFGGFG
ncbi:MAG: aldehyde dehydrogenase family protein, partial [Myxococcaceae bacterium]|nr:aldehyde dehydrogenase family protein [Myxococcaceae bacterium]